MHLTTEIPLCLFNTVPLLFQTIMLPSESLFVVNVKKSIRLDDEGRTE